MNNIEIAFISGVIIALGIFYLSADCYMSPCVFFYRIKRPMNALFLASTLLSTSLLYNYRGNIMSMFESRQLNTYDIGQLFWLYYLFRAIFFHTLVRYKGKQLTHILIINVFMSAFLILLYKYVFFFDFFVSAIALVSSSQEVWSFWLSGRTFFQTCRCFGIVPAPYVCSLIISQWVMWVTSCQLPSLPRTSAGPQLRLD